MEDEQILTTVKVPITRTGHVHRLLTVYPMILLDGEILNQFWVSKVKGIDKKGKEIREYLDNFQTYEVGSYNEGDIIRITVGGRVTITSYLYVQSIEDGIMELVTKIDDKWLNYAMAKELADYMAA